MKLATKLILPLRKGAAAASYDDTAVALLNDGYWPAKETAGTNADEYGGTAAKDGTFSGVTLNSAAGPAAVGGTAGAWDGVDDYLDLFSATLAGDVSMATGSISVWFQDDDWSNATSRFIAHFYSAATNRIMIEKTGANTLRFRARLASSNATITHTLSSPSGWYHLLVTWSDAANADELKAYINGSQVETTVTGLGTAAGSLTAFTVGREQTTGGTSWDGNIMAIGVTSDVLTAGNASTLAGS